MNFFSFQWRQLLCLLLFALSVMGPAQAAAPVYLNTAEGIQRLEQADLNRPYFMLAPYVDVQENMGFCGPASMAAVLNSFPGLPHPISSTYSPYRYFTQSGLFNAETSQVKTYAQVSQSGLTLAEASSFLQKLNVQTQLFYGANLSAGSLRVLIKDSLADPHARIIVDFSRRTLGQIGDGHYSPLVAYDSASDSVLIVDVAKFKYPPFWITLEDLLRSIQTIDPDSGNSRGVIVIRDPH